VPKVTLMVLSFLDVNPSICAGSIIICLVLY